MKHGLWGHALLLASKMDNRTHARVMTRYSFAYCLLVWYGYLSDNKRSGASETFMLKS